MARANTSKTAKLAAQKPANGRYYLSFQTRDETTKANLFDYFNGSLCRFATQREGKERAIDAMTAFWQVYALRAKGASIEQQKESARHCLHALMRQVEAICHDFGLASPFAEPDTATAKDSAMLESLLQLLQASPALKAQPLPAAVETPKAQASPVVADQTAQEEMIFIDDDLLGDLT